MGKHKKEKKSHHKKEKKSKSKSKLHDDQSRSNEIVKDDRTKLYGAEKISNEEYFLRNQEFRVWLKMVKHRYVLNSMTP